MAKDLFNRYVWLVDTIYRAGKITIEEINERWLRGEMSKGKEIPLRTFHNHRTAIEELFDINIECDKRNGYVYYIENRDDMEKDGVRSWLLNTFAVNNLIKAFNQSENIPAGQNEQLIKDAYQYLVYKSNTISEDTQAMSIIYNLIFFKNHYDKAKKQF